MFRLGPLGGIRIMTQDDPKMSRALLVIHRRLELMRRKLTPYKQLGDSVVLPVTSTSTPTITESSRDILPSYPFTKAMRKSLSFSKCLSVAKKLVTATDRKRTHKLSTTIL